MNSREEFDRVRATGKKLKAIFERDRLKYAAGTEEYIIRAVEEAYGDCPACGGIGEKKVLGITLRCSTCHGKGKIIA